MTRKEAIETIEMAISQIEWDYPIDYVAAFDKAIEILKQPEIVRCGDCIHWDKGHTEECDNLDSVCFHNGWCKPDWFCADGERKVSK